MLETPPIVRWYRAYCFVSAALGVVIYGIGGWRLYVLGGEVQDPAFDRAQFNVLVLILVGVGGFFTVVNFLAAFVKTTPAGWLLALTNLIIGALSLVCLPFSVPIIVFWVRDDVKRHFGLTR